MIWDRYPGYCGSNALRIGADNLDRKRFIAVADQFTVNRCAARPNVSGAVDSSTVSLKVLKNHIVCVGRAVQFKVIIENGFTLIFDAVAAEAYFMNTGRIEIVL